MGVKGLSKFIKENVPNAIQTRSLSDLRDNVVAVDTNYYIYKYTISTDDYIKKFASQYLHLVSFGIKPLYVFDGKPPSEKQKVIDKRKKVNLKKNVEVNNSKIKTLKKFFKDNNIQSRSFVSGNMVRQLPYQKYGDYKTYKNAEELTLYARYFGLNVDLKESQIIGVCNELNNL